jgi:hypothetical protein
MKNMTHGMNPSPKNSGLVEGVHLGLLEGQSGLRGKVTHEESKITSA